MRPQERARHQGEALSASAVWNHGGSPAMFVRSADITIGDDMCFANLCVSQHTRRGTAANKIQNADARPGMGPGQAVLIKREARRDFS
jgi:hypothetical protein